MAATKAAFGKWPHTLAGTRVLRLLRLFRVVRLGKVTRFASFLRDKFESEVAYTQFSALESLPQSVYFFFREVMLMCDELDE